MIYEEGHERIWQGVQLQKITLTAFMRNGKEQELMDGEILDGNIDRTLLWLTLGAKEERSVKVDH